MRYNKKNKKKLKESTNLICMYYFEMTLFLNKQEMALEKTDRVIFFFKEDRVIFLCQYH